MAKHVALEWELCLVWNECVEWRSGSVQGDMGSPTQLMLDRPYQGATATGKKWQLANLCGPGTQPFMVGVAASAWSYAFKADANPMYRDLLFGATAWIRQNGVQASTRGLYYGRGYPNCEPISDNLKNCSYNSLNRGSVEESRFLNGEVLGALASAYEMTSDPGLKQSADDLFGAVFGKEGGPAADSVFVSLLDQSRSGSAPKNFGFFFGAGNASSWPALRGRIGAASVTGPAVEITQAVPINPPCVFGLQSSLVSIGAAGEVVRILLTASGAGCVWSASSDVNWAQIIHRPVLVQQQSSVLCFQTSLDPRAQQFCTFQASISLLFRLQTRTRRHSALSNFCISAFSAVCPVQRNAIFRSARG